MEIDVNLSEPDRWVCANLQDFQTPMIHHIFFQQPTHIITMDYYQPTTFNYSAIFTCQKNKAMVKIVLVIT